MFSSLIGAGILTGLGALGCLIWLASTPHDGKNQMQRLSILAGFAFLTGCNLGPLLDLAVMVNPALVSCRISQIIRTVIWFLNFYAFLLLVLYNF